MTGMFFRVVSRCHDVQLLPRDSPTKARGGERAERASYGVEHLKKRTKSSRITGTPCVDYNGFWVIVAWFVLLRSYNVRLLLTQTLWRSRGGERAKRASYGGPYLGGGSPFVTK